MGFLDYDVEIRKIICSTNDRVTQRPLPTRRGSQRTLPDRTDMTALIAVCDAFCAQVNTRVHRETAAAPVERLVVEQGRLHVLAAAPYSAALGETRLVNIDQTVRSGRCVTPPHLSWPSTRCGSAPSGTNWSSSRISTHYRSDHPGCRPCRPAGRGRPAPAFDSGPTADRAGPLPRPPARPQSGAAAPAPKPTRLNSGGEGRSLVRRRHPVVMVGSDEIEVDRRLRAGELVCGCGGSLSP
jgi:hypothetical protein